MLIYALSESTFNTTQPGLLLGLGGGSIIRPLRQAFHYTGKITAVELDPKMVQIAKQEFGIRPTKQLEIKIEDALTFVKKSPQLYGLIIIDLFIDNQVPPQFYGVLFWQHLIPRLQKNGTIIFNAGLGKEADRHIFDLHQRFSDQLHFKDLHHSRYANRLLIITKR